MDASRTPPPDATNLSVDAPDKPDAPLRSPSCAGIRPADRDVCETCAALARGDPFGLQRRDAVRRPRRGEGG